MTNNNLDINKLTPKQILGFEHFDEFIQMCSDMQTNGRKVVVYKTTCNDHFLTDVDKKFERCCFVVDTNNKLKETKEA